MKADRPVLMPTLVVIGLALGVIGLVLGFVMVLQAVT
jgi:hypothetical protein